MTEGERLATLETKVENHETLICGISDAVSQIKDSLLGRPSWAVTTVVALLTGACGTMAMYIITKF